MVIAYFLLEKTGKQETSGRTAGAVADQIRNQAFNWR
jgi:hypothetical protein